MNTIQTCAVCGCEANMTRDHIVPSWLLFNTAKFDINWKELVDKNDLKGKMWHLVCGPCNLAKGGTIDWKDPVVRVFMKGFIASLQEKIDYHEGPRKLIVICGCGRKEPCAVVPSVVSAPLISAKKQHYTKNCWCGHTEITLVQGSAII